MVNAVSTGPRRARQEGPVPWASLAVVVAALTGAAVLAARVRAHPGPLSIDRRVMRTIVDHRPSGLASAAKVFVHIGDPGVLPLLAVVAAVLLWTRFRAVFPSVLPLGALLVADAIGLVGKKVIDRPRPPVAYHLVAESDASFPSGHATGSAAFFLALALVLSPTLRRRASQVALVVGALLLAGLIGFARLLLGVHWVSDVTAGWLIGVACAVAAPLAAEALLRLPVMAWAGPDRSGRSELDRPTEPRAPASAAGPRSADR
jgi:membrane-associated phospholipid phosphatase